MGALTALQAVRDTGKVQPGQSVLVNGASSGVGIYAVQIAVAMGAKVTGVCSGRNAEMVRSLGATTSSTTREEDFTAHERAIRRHHRHRLVDVRSPTSAR